MYTVTQYYKLLVEEEWAEQSRDKAEKSRLNEENIEGENQEEEVRSLRFYLCEEKGKVVTHVRQQDFKKGRGSTHNIYVPTRL